MFAQNFQILTHHPPCSYFLVLLPPSTYVRFSELPSLKKFYGINEFSNEKSGSELKEKNQSFYKLNVTDQYFLHTLIYTITTRMPNEKNVKSKKKKKKKKKCLSIFNKKTPLLDQVQNSKTFSNCEATYKKEFCLLFEKSGYFFHRANVQIDRLHTLLPFCFHSLFKYPPPP